MTESLVMAVDGKLAESNSKPQELSGEEKLGEVIGW